MRILITGAGGYVGRHLLQTLLLSPARELHGTYRTIPSYSLPAGCTWHQVDLNSLLACHELIKSVQPEQIYHLAGNIRAGRASDADAKAAWHDNLQATINLYESCIRDGVFPRIVFVSTGAIYGDTSGNAPLTEDSPLHPVTHYAKSKAEADRLSGTYWTKSQLPVIRARLFNYLGPGQDEQTALSRFGYDLARLELKQANPAVLHVGNLQAERDFTDITDVVRALTLLMQHGQPGEAYNVASGISYPMRWYVKEMIKMVSIPIEVRSDRQLFRHAETQRLQVDISKLQWCTGWRTTVKIQDSLRTLLDSCRATVASEVQSR